MNQEKNKENLTLNTPQGQGDLEALQQQIAKLQEENSILRKENSDLKKNATASQKKKKRKKEKENTDPDLESIFYYQLCQSENLFSHKFPTYRGQKSNRQILAEYLLSLKMGTRFNNETIKRATGLTDTQLSNAKRNVVIHDYLQSIEEVPGNPYCGWIKI